MDKCLSGTKVSELRFRNTLRIKSARPMSLTLHDSGVLEIETDGLMILSLPDETSLPRRFSLRKIDLHDVNLDVRSKLCKRANGCAVFKMYGSCCSNSELRGKK